jgi:membrane protein DedA with SNARE-associated domain
MIELLLHWIAEHGYGVIFIVFALGIFGLPLPNDGILAYLGHLIFKGRLHPVPTVAAAVFGTLCGMTFNYLLGRTFGLYLVNKFGSLVRLTPEKIQKMHNWFERSGRWGLMFGYYLPGVRHLTAFAAGTSKMTFWEFALFGYAGGFLWSGTFIALGYFLEEHWSRETQRIHHILLGCTAAVLILAAGYVIVNKIRGRGGA